jgi:hypothetical protein
MTYCGPLRDRGVPRTCSPILSSASSPGLSRRSRSQVTALKFPHTNPATCHFFRYQPCLPSARPVLDIFLALNGLIGRLVNLEIDQTIDLVGVRVSPHQFVFVLPHTANQVVRDANIQRTARTAGEHVKIKLPHARVSLIGMAGTSPAMTRVILDVHQLVSPRAYFRTSKLPHALSFANRDGRDKLGHDACEFGVPTSRCPPRFNKTAAARGHARRRRRE